MKKSFYLFFLIALLLNSACHTSKNGTIHPVVVTNTDNNRVEYIEILRIDTITVTIEIPVESVKQIVPDSTSHLETSFAESDAWINPDGTLGHSINNKNLSIPKDVTVPVKDTQTNNTSESIKEIPVPYPEPVYIEREFSRWEKFRLGSFWYMAGIIVVSLGWNFRKPIFGIIKKISSK